MSNENIKELIERSTNIRKYFRKVGGNGIPVLNVIDGDEFQEWLADIKATIVQLKSDSLTESIMDLTNSFNG